MANYSSLLAAVNAAITANGTGAITGPVLNTVLQQMIVSLGQGGYIFKGRAIPTTDPGSPDQNVFYIATTPGTYTNFSSIVVAAGECAILKGSGSSWSKEATGIDLVSVSQNTLTIGGVAQGELAGQLIENPEWVRVVTDSEDRILYGVKTDGKFYFGDGCPPQVQDYISNVLGTYSASDYADVMTFLGNLIDGDSLTTLLATKVDKVIDKSLIDADFASSQQALENPEWMKVLTDNNGKILEGRKADGTKVEYTDVEYPNGIPNDIKDYFTIENPYEDIKSKVRHCAISHEHMSGTHAQERLEAAVNDGVDIICASNYTPGVPVYPLNNFSYEYIDWSFVKDGNGNIVYEKYDDGTIKTLITRTGSEFKIPALKREKKTLTGSFSDFIKDNGQECVVADLVQLPNAEHAGYVIAENTSSFGGMHINLIGTAWADAVNGNPADSVFVADLAQYNQENNYTLTQPQFHAIFSLWSLQDILVRAQYDYLFEGKIFGTINHPGFSNMKDWFVDELMKKGSNIFKAMEIYNNGETPTEAEYSINFYDKTLMRGYKFWCVAVDDWGNPDHQYNPNNPERRGCNLMYLPADYESLSAKNKRQAVLDAYINGSFAAAGYGTLDLSDVKVKGNNISVSFNVKPDSTYIVIDGVRTPYGSVQELTTPVDKDNTFVRFEAYKDDDFICTQPFFIHKKN